MSTTTDLRQSHPDGLARDQVDPYKMDFPRALKALKILLDDPEDTSQVFVIIRSLSGKSQLRGYNRFVKTWTGQTILAENRSLSDVLQDHDALAALPADSFGARYLSFVRRENLSPDGLIDASAVEEEPENPNVARYAARLRDQHDLWHVLTGYGRDVVGEACLLAFTVGQTFNPGIALIALAGALKLRKDVGMRIFSALWHAYRDGRRAAWLPAQDWEALLARPIEDVRAELGINPPKVYPQMVESELLPAA